MPCPPARGQTAPGVFQIALCDGRLKSLSIQPRHMERDIFPDLVLDSFFVELYRCFGFGSGLLATMFSETNFSARASESCILFFAYTS